jgi:chitinase
VAKATITCATTGASIYYTTDGSEPTTASSAYSSALTFTQTTTLKAKAFKNGLKDSKENVVKYVFLQ